MRHHTAIDIKHHWIGPSKLPDYIPTRFPSYVFNRRDTPGFQTHLSHFMSVTTKEHMMNALVNYGAVVVSVTAYPWGTTVTLPGQASPCPTVQVWHCGHTLFAPGSLLWPRSSLIWPHSSFSHTPLLGTLLICPPDHPGPRGPKHQPRRGGCRLARMRGRCTSPLSHSPTTKTIRFSDDENERRMGCMQSSLMFSMTTPADPRFMRAAAQRDKDRVLDRPE